MSYDHISPTYQSYIAATSVIKEPEFYLEAVQDERWIEAMQHEIQALECNILGSLLICQRERRLLGVDGFIRLNTNHQEK